MELALDWRLKVRKAFETYFAKNYIVTDFISTLGRNNTRQNRYLLQKATPELFAHIGVELKSGENK
jgi:predicted GNAT superfamily acetyltransferase